MKIRNLFYKTDFQNINSMSSDTVVYQTAKGFVTSVVNKIEPKIDMIS